MLSDTSDPNNIDYTIGQRKIYVFQCECAKAYCDHH